MTTSCAFCGGPRMNGMPLKNEDGRWVRANGDDPNARLACRSCAKERL